MNVIKYFLYMSFIVSTLFLGVIDEKLFAYTGNDSIEVNLGVDGCNNNSICEPATGETSLNCPNDCSTPPPPSPTGGGSSSGGVFIFNVRVYSDKDYARIEFKTRLPSFCSVKWGETSEYKMGTIRSTIYVTEHIALVSNLIPGKQYYFYIECQNGYMQIVAKDSGVFTTINLPTAVYVLNPSNVQSSIKGKGILVEWDNPTDKNFSYVRVVRNTDRFHASPFIGVLIYEGVSEKVIDYNIKLDTKYFYTVFGRNIFGDFSSGAGTYNTLRSLNIGSVVPPEIIRTEKEFITGFIVTQHGEVLLSINNILQGFGGEPVVVESTPNSFSGFTDLWLEIRKPRLEDYKAYLFSYIPEKKIFQTIIPFIEQKGDYELRIFGFNMDHTVLLSQGVLNIPVDTFIKGTEKEFSIQDILILLISILLLIIFIAIIRRIFKTSS